MEGATVKLLWELVRWLPEKMRKLFYTDSNLWVAAYLVWLYATFTATRSVVILVERYLPKYAWLAMSFYDYLGFLPVILVYYFMIAHAVIGKREHFDTLKKERKLAEWQGYWEAIKFNGKEIKPVKTSIGVVVLYKLGERHYDIVPLNQEDVDIEEWEKFHASFSKLRFNHPPEEILKEL